MRRLGPRVFFLVFFAYTLTVSIFIQVPFMFYNDKEGLDAARKEPERRIWHRLGP